MEMIFWHSSIFRESDYGLVGVCYLKCRPVGTLGRCAALVCYLKRVTMGLLSIALELVC